MPTPIPIYGVIAPTGVLLRARVRNPDGSTNVEFALAEDGAGLGVYAGTANLVTVDDTSGVPYTAEVREVTAQNSGAFDASTTVRAARQPVGWNGVGGADGTFVSALGIPGVNVVQTNSEPLVPDAGGGGAGSGDTSINHDGAAGVTVDGAASSADCMRVLDELGAPMDDAELTAYLKSDYDAGNKGPSFRQAFVRTGSDGRWVESMRLDAGTYTFEASHDMLGTIVFDVVVP